MPFKLFEFLERFMIGVFLVTLAQFQKCVLAIITLVQSSIGYVCFSTRPTQIGTEIIVFWV